METPNTASLSARMAELGADEVDLVRVYRTFNAGAEAFRAASEAHGRRRADERRRRSESRTRVIRTDYLARVEGEGAMYVRLDGRDGRRRQAAHLRAAAVLRGVAARPGVHRGARHHRADLRHLPGRLPDERGAGDGGRLRRARSTRARCATCAGCSTAASGSRATACTSTCSTRPTSSATRARSRWRATTARSSSRGCR